MQECWFVVFQIVLENEVTVRKDTRMRTRVSIGPNRSLLMFVNLVNSTRTGVPHSGWRRCSSFAEHVFRSHGTHSAMLKLCRATTVPALRGFRLFRSFRLHHRRTNQLRILHNRVVQADGLSWD